MSIHPYWELFPCSSSVSELLEDSSLRYYAQGPDWYSFAELSSPWVVDRSFPDDLDEYRDILHDLRGTSRFYLPSHPGTAKLEKYLSEEFPLGTAVNPLLFAVGSPNLPDVSQFSFELTPMSVSICTPSRDALLHTALTSPSSRVVPMLLGALRNLRLRDIL